MIAPAPIKENGPWAAAWIQWFAMASRLLSVRTGTTAQRPALGSEDSGTLYFDTTLAAAGKPIWWTGSTWVDATGAAV